MEGGCSPPDSRRRPCNWGRTERALHEAFMLMSCACAQPTSGARRPLSGGPPSSRRRTELSKASASQAETHDSKHTVPPPVRHATVVKVFTWEKSLAKTQKRGWQHRSFPCAVTLTPSLLAASADRPTAQITVSPSTSAVDGYSKKLAQAFSVLKDTISTETIGQNIRA